jgi:hypothetical protein
MGDEVVFVLRIHLHFDFDVIFVEIQGDLN